MRESGHSLPIAIALLTLALLAPRPVAAQFDSGSTGANGPFPPAGMPIGTTSILFDLIGGQVTFFPSNESIVLPNVPPGGFADGVVNFTTFNVPSGITLRFGGNVPPDIRAQGDVNIDGTINVSGGDGGQFDGSGGRGGIGGFNGGQGGTFTVQGGSGLGPGGGGAGGGSGGHATAGTPGQSTPGTGGETYGSVLLRPLIGGSGGGGNISNADGVLGTGGGGGGGAIGIASSTTITINATGIISANGGRGGTIPFVPGFGAGSGAGGGLRLIANRILGFGALQAFGGGPTEQAFGVGGAGRVRLEAFDLEFGGSVGGLRSNGAPGPINLVNAPVIRVILVGGEEVPPHPNGAMGAADVIVSNPGTKEIQIETTNVPAATTVSVLAKPADGNPASIGPQMAQVPAGADPRITTVALDFPTTGLYFVEAQTTVGP